MSLEWHWLPKQFGMADGGAYARLLDAHAPVHDLVAREVTQNSWDAARRHRAELGQDDAASAVPFQLVYEFKTLMGSEKVRLTKALKLTDLRNILKQQGHQPLKFEKGKTILDRHASAEPLDVLYIHDYGATGLRGDPIGDRLAESDFYRAFGQIGGNDRELGGGSFGFGKSAFIKSSRIRCVIAYSSFMQQEGDPVTRRLWGFVYWPSYGHKTGVGQLGLLRHGDTGLESVPATDELADALAEEFGFLKRDSTTPANCGTSLLIVDHVLDPSDLQTSLENFWWPALETFKGTFDISLKANGEVFRPTPMQNDKLKPFIRAFEIAADPNAQLKNGEHKANWRAIRDEGVSVGELAVVRDEVDIDAQSVDGRFAEIALIREPRMVVRYQSFAGSTANTAIKGVYIASKDADSFLRRCEPATHDDWEEAIDESYGDGWERTLKVVTSVRKRIRKEVASIQKILRQQPKRTQAQMSWANDLFAKLFSEPVKAGKQPGKKDRSKRAKRHAAAYESERLSRTRRISKEGSLLAEETWSVQLPESATSSAIVEVEFFAWVLADGNEVSPTDRIPTKAKQRPVGFKADKQGCLRGVMVPAQAYEFQFETEPYDHDWNMRSDLVVRLVSAPTDSSEELA